MSGASSGSKHWLTRVVQAFLLVLIFALLYVATRAVPEIHGGVGAIAAVGFLLLAGTLASELIEALGIPHLTGYLVAGIVAGPNVLNLVDHHTVERLSPVNALALALIALAGGAELKLDLVRKGLRSLAWATLVQSVMVLTFMTCVFLGIRRFIPFASAVSLTTATGIALLWATLSVTRSPSAVLGILAQVRPKGPLTSFSLTFVMASDIVVVVLLATMIAIARPMVEPGASFSTRAFSALGHEILGSVALGTTLGLVLAAYLRLVNKQLLVVFLLLGFGLSEVLRYLHFDALLTFMVAGFVVQNLTKQGEKFLHAIEQTGSVVYVVFFATAGADLDVPLLRTLWPVALALAGARALTTYLAARLGSRLANDPPVLRKWAWSGLVSQAGLTLGLSVVIAREFPSFGTPFRALAIATVALNEMIGPILFKLALDRSGEASREAAPSLPPPSVAPPPSAAIEPTESS
jgi:Kef-type K+ transport system membrane component KefB